MKRKELIEEYNFGVYNGILFCFGFAYLCFIISRLLMFLVVFLNFNAFVLPVLLFVVLIVLICLLLSRKHYYISIVFFLLLLSIKVLINFSGLPYQLNNYSLYDEEQKKILLLSTSYFVSTSNILFIIFAIYRIKKNNQYTSSKYISPQHETE